MTAIKRSRIEIYCDIIDSILCEISEVKVASPTRVSHRANLPYDRFQALIDQLEKLELIVKGNGGTLNVTKKGLENLKEMHTTRDFLRRMGLSA